jgi:hypothetical protein
VVGSEALEALGGSQGLLSQVHGHSHSTASCRTHLSIISLLEHLSSISQS